MVLNQSTEIMKKLNSNFIIAAMAIAMTASCTGKFEQNYTAEEGETNPPATSDLVSMTFSAFNGDEVIDTKTTYRGRDLYWETTDVISVFSVAETVIKTDFTVSSISDDKKEASFTGMADPNAQEYYAAYPHAEANEYKNGTFTVNIPTEQVGVSGGFASNTNVAVATAGKEGSFQFKNLSTLIYFKFETPGDAANTKSVTIKARKSEDDAQTQEFFGLTGNVEFTLDEKGIPVISEGSVDHVTLQSPKGGFVSGVNYIIPVCSVGDCKGLQVIFEDNNGQKYVKNNNIDLKLQRSTIFNLNSIPNPFDGHALPEEFTVTLDFATSWPFNETCKSVTNQVKSSSDIYTFNYNYTLNGVDKTIVLESGLMWGMYSKDLNYEYKDGGLVFNVDGAGDNCGGLVKMPVVPGRCLKSVTVEHQSGSAKIFHLLAGYSNANGATKQIISGTSKTEAAVYNLLVEYNGTEYGLNPDEIFSIRFRSRETKLTKLTITYAKPTQE